MNILEVGHRRFTSHYFSSYDNSSNSWEVKMLAWGENISDILLPMKEVSAEMYNVITNAVYNCGGIAEYLSLNIPSSREYLCYLAGGIEPDQIALFAIDDEYDKYCRNMAIRAEQLHREELAKQLPMENWDEAMLELLQREYPEEMQKNLDIDNTSPEKVLGVAKIRAGKNKDSTMRRCRERGIPFGGYDDRHAVICAFLAMAHEFDEDCCGEEYEAGENYWLRKANIDFSKAGHMVMSEKTSSSYYCD